MNRFSGVFCFGFLAVFGAILLAGCGRSAFFDFTGSATYAEALPHSKQASIIDNFETKAAIRANYLNAIYPNDKEYNSTESFLVGIYIDKDFSDAEKKGLNNPLFSLTLNGQKPLEYRLVDKDDPLLKIMPLVNRWNLYYVVKFAPTSSLNLTLSDLDANQSVTLAFSRPLSE